MRVRGSGTSTYTTTNECSEGVPTCQLLHGLQETAQEQLLAQGGLEQNLPGVYVVRLCGGSLRDGSQLVVDTLI